MLRPLPFLALIALALLAPQASAQLAVAPQSLSVTLPQHEAAERTVTLTNMGMEPLAFCLSFDRPLQRVGIGEPGRAHLADAAASVAGAACGPYGEVLHRIREEDLPPGVGLWLPFGLAMTPGGRLFTHSAYDYRRTFELTPTLAYVRHFEHPSVEEVAPSGDTKGIAYDEASGTLWWLNEEADEEGPVRNLLLEGDLDGVPTGRRIALPAEHEGEPAYALGLSYEPAADLFYYADVLAELVWAVGRDGTVPPAYPVSPSLSPGYKIGRGVDAHGGAGGGPEGVRIEYGAYPSGGPGRDRVVVVDRWGGAQGEVLETPVPALLFEGNGAGLRANPLRSWTDPNGVMYMTFVNFDDEGIVGVRPHPPSWLVVDSAEGPEASWDGTLDPGESRAGELTFRAGSRGVGEYTSALKAFEAATGEAVELPLSLTVTEGTDAEDGAEPAGAPRLSVYPNPVSGAATVTLALPSPQSLRVTVFDVLGREVAVLHDGLLQSGLHRLTLDGRGLPSGLYVVRATGNSFATAQRLTLVR